MKNTKEFSGKLLISGGSGMIGTHLTTFFNPLRVNVLSRRPQPQPRANAYYWNIEKHEVDPKAMEGVDYVVNLAGSNLSGALSALPFSGSKRREVYDSRIYATKLLVNTIRNMNKKPKVFVSASGINYYNFTNDHERVYDEDSPSGDSFLSLLCRDWEDATKPLTDMGVRVVRLRFSLVLHPHKGLLRRMCSLARAGLLSILGSGEQKMNFIHVEDLCRMIIHAMADDKWGGVFNAAADYPVTNRHFTEYIVTYIARSQYITRVPGFLLRLSMRRFADVLLQGGIVLAEKAKQYGFSLAYPSFDECMESLTSDDRLSWVEEKIISQDKSSGGS